MDNPPFRRNWPLIVCLVLAPVMLSVVLTFVEVGGLSFFILPFCLGCPLLAGFLFENPNRGSVAMFLLMSVFFGAISLFLAFVTFFFLFVATCSTPVGF